MTKIYKNDNAKNIRNIFVIYVTLKHLNPKSANMALNVSRRMYFYIHDVKHPK